MTTLPPFEGVLVIGLEDTKRESTNQHHYQTKNMTEGKSVKSVGDATARQRAATRTQQTTGAIGFPKSKERNQASP